MNRVALQSRAFGALPSKTAALTQAPGQSSSEGADGQADEPRTSIFVCGRPRITCSSHDCGRQAFRKCSFAVKREGQAAQCDRPVCPACVTLVEGVELCSAHGRVATAKARKA
jgi:hypothetical protein